MRSRDLVRERNPSDSIVGEELPPVSGSSSRIWYIDPIDGTNNFVLGLPDVVFSIAVYEDSKPIAGVIDLPLRRQRCGFDGFEVDFATWPSPEQPAPRYFGLPGNFATAPRDRLSHIMSTLGQSVDGIRIGGSLAADLARTASGQLCGRASLMAKSVDMAAGAPLAALSGVVVLGDDGKPWTIEATGVLACRSVHLAQTLSRAVFPRNDEHSPMLRPIDEHSTMVSIEAVKGEREPNPGTVDGSIQEATVDVIVRQGSEMWECELSTGATFRAVSLRGARQTARERLDRAADEWISMRVDVEEALSERLALVSEASEGQAIDSLHRLTTYVQRDGVPLGAADLAELAGVSIDGVRESFNRTYRDWTPS